VGRSSLVEVLLGPLVMAVVGLVEAEERLSEIVAIEQHAGAGGRANVVPQERWQQQWQWGSVVVLAGLGGLAVWLAALELWPVVERVGWLTFEHHAVAVGVKRVVQTEALANAGTETEPVLGPGGMEVDWLLDERPGIG